MPQRALWCWTLLASLALQPGAANAVDYRIDPKETSSSFEVWMLGFIPIRGKFRHTTGAMTFDAANQGGSIEVLIDTTSVEANSARVQAVARGPGFFDVEKYPRMDFKSSRFVFEGTRLHSIEGMLNLTGTTQPVTLAVNHATCRGGVARVPPVCRAEAVLTVKRSAFGMKAWSHSLGDDVTIRIAIVAFAEAGAAKAPNGEPPASPADAIDAPKQP